MIQRVEAVTWSAISSIVRCSIAFTTTSSTPEPFTVAITGGTGEFRTAHGEVEVTEESDTVAELKVKLVL